MGSNVPAITAATVAKVLPASPVEVTNGSTTKAQKAFDAIIGKFVSADMDLAAAKSKALAEGEAYQGVRVTLLIELAEAATKGKWEHKYAVQGIEAAIKAYEAKHGNQRQSTLRQFATECGRAIHPQVCAHVKADFAKAKKMWDDEGKRIDAAKAEAIAAEEKFDRKAVDTPLRDAFKRQYHMVVGSNGLLAARSATDKKGKPDEARREMAESPEMLAERVQTDERQDAKRAARAVERVVTMLNEIAAEFPHPRWGTVIEFLEGMDKDALGKARVRNQREQRNASGLRKANKPAVSDDDINDATDDLIDE